LDFWPTFSLEIAVLAVIKGSFLHSASFSPGKSLLTFLRWAVLSLRKQILGHLRPEFLWDPVEDPYFIDPITEVTAGIVDGTGTAVSEAGRISRDASCPDLSF
jgi:hypothetical protein